MLKPGGCDLKNISHGFVQDDPCDKQNHHNEHDSLEVNLRQLTRLINLANVNYLFSTLMLKFQFPTFSDETCLILFSKSN
jgi:hypothetical protein